jgi:AcrR family transcriptional regulator
MPNSRVPPPRPERPEPAPTRREEVLEAALALIAQHGIAGASLRKLAKELGMSQPSLYHYFASKDALVTEIIEYCAQKMLDSSLALAPPQSSEEVPRFARDAVVALWSSERHPRFVRFLFVVALESKQNRAAIQRVFEERLYPGFAAVADSIGRDAAEKEDLRGVLRMVVYSLGLMFIEERALFGKSSVDAEVLRYSDWVVEAGERLLRERRPPSSRGRKA